MELRGSNGIQNINSQFWRNGSRFGPSFVVHFKENRFNVLCCEILRINSFSFGLGYGKRTSSTFTSAAFSDMFDVFSLAKAIGGLKVIVGVAYSYSYAHKTEYSVLKSSVSLKTRMWTQEPQIKVALFDWLSKSIHAFEFDGNLADCVSIRWWNSTALPSEYPYPWIWLPWSLGAPTEFLTLKSKPKKVCSQFKADVSFCAFFY